MTDFTPFDAYAKLSHDEKTNFLLRLAHELTIVGRDSYDLDTEGLRCPGRLRALNEIQHRILASCRALMENDSKRYPDDVLLHIILDHPEDKELERQVLDSFDRVFSRFASAA